MKTLNYARMFPFTTNAIRDNKYSHGLMRGLLMDIGLEGVIKKFEEHLGPWPVKIILVLASFLVVLWILQGIRDAWRSLAESVVVSDMWLFTFLVVIETVFLCVISYVLVNWLLQRYIREKRRIDGKIIHNVKGKANP